MGGAAKRVYILAIHIRLRPEPFNIRQIASLRNLAFSLTLARLAPRSIDAAEHGSAGGTSRLGRKSNRYVLMLSVCMPTRFIRANHRPRVGMPTFAKAGSVCRRFGC